MASHTKKRKAALAKAKSILEKPRYKQGYDDREDERLAMKRGKISKKDFVGSNKKKTRSRRDDAGFEVRKSNTELPPMFESKMDKMEYGGALQTMTGGVNADPRFDIYDVGQFAEYGGVLQPMTGGVNADPRFDIYDTPQFADKGAVIQSITGGVHPAVNPVIGYADGGSIPEIGDDVRGFNHKYGTTIKDVDADGKRFKIKYSDDWDSPDIWVSFDNVVVDDEDDRTWHRVWNKKSQMADGGEIHKVADSMTDSEYNKKFSQLNDKQKKKYETLVRLGDSPKLALATVLLHKETEWDESTTKAYTMADGVETTQQSDDELMEKIRAILKEELPNFYTFVKKSKSSFSGDEYLVILMAASNYEINRVRGQYPQAVSLMLNLKDMDLHPQVFGGNGGQSIYLIPDPNDPKEKYLAMASRKVPFRRPKPNEKAVLEAIRKFAVNYRNLLKENKDRLMYGSAAPEFQRYVDYDNLLDYYGLGGYMYMEDGGNVMGADGPLGAWTEFEEKINLGKIAYTSKKKANEVEITVRLKKVKGAQDWDTLNWTSGYALSMSGGIWNASHRDWVTGGQMLDKLKPYFRNNSDVIELINIWEKYHLNDMKAGSKKQTEAVQKWLDEGNKYDYSHAVEYLKSIDLYEDRGYKYGHSWLFEPIPESVVKKVVFLVRKLKSSMAMGGVTAHGLQEGDMVTLATDNILHIYNQKTGKYSVLDISTGERTDYGDWKGPKPMKRGGAFEANPDKIKNADAKEYTENMLPFIGNNLSGMVFPNGDYLVSSYGYYPIWYYSKSEEKWYGNKDKFSVTTAKQMSQSRPTYNATMLSNQELNEKIAMMQEGKKFAMYGMVTDFADPMKQVSPMLSK